MRIKTKASDRRVDAIAQQTRDDSLAKLEQREQRAAARDSADSTSSAEEAQSPKRAPRTAPETKVEGGGAETKS